MQTYRDCERTLNYEVDFAWTCNNPQIFADLVCGPVASTDSPMVQGAGRGMMYGGGHLAIRYNSAVLASSEAPCLHSIKVISALVVLPLLEDDLTPAYLPNLAIARSQLSVVHATQSDTDENILWVWDEQLDLININCNTGGGVTPCPFFDLSCKFETDTPLSAWIAGGFTQFGRMRRDETLRARRRLREREAIFLLTEIVNGAAQTTGDVINWPIRRNVYFRYAVRPIR